MQPTDQNRSNHRRVYPIFHLIALPILAANVIYAVYLLTRAQVFDNWANLLVAIALVLLAVSSRHFATVLQDRIIRLEEQVRYERLLPDDLRTRIHEFTPDQYIGLRFASDRELAGLARQVLDQRIHDREVIKGMVQEWRGDYLRV